MQQAFKNISESFAKTLGGHLKSFTICKVVERSAIVLAAGKGTRMNIDYPKVLTLSEEGPLLGILLRELLSMDLKEIVLVTGFEKDKVEEYVTNAFGDDRIVFAHQEEQLGTGHALAVGFTKLSPCERLFVLLGDVPLVTAKSLCSLDDYVVAHNLSCCFFSMLVYQKNEYGRVIRDPYSGRVLSIEEYRHTTSAQKLIREVSTGVFCFLYPDLKQVLSDTFDYLLTTCKGKGIEFYLPLLLEVFAAKGMLYDALLSEDVDEFIGVNRPDELEELNKALLRRRILKFKQNGVLFSDPSNIYIAPEVHLEAGVVIDSHVKIAGKTIVRAGTQIGSYSIIKNSEIDENCEIMPFTYIENAKIGQNCRIGPFARLREGTVLQDFVAIGNFVETKNARLENNVKANHHSYLGDCWIGTGTNVGAGTITCNFDGFKKNFTQIGQNCLIGANVNLIAPVNLGSNVVVGAGSSITKDVPDNSLVVERGETKTIKEGYERYVARRSK
ncbi:MAG: bifunctional UDP-N-acetylglucosamine diphosphorylase/glucosamine-1-phosphate N-acetyltransferase GlmU [Deltaproteobacteria bacterium]|nr:bifunctional UDP-N-acetylglucosamine diphosphorylase/glucosamine-1-phosphate N-acetyltransferase GlmU [Deltaproteobacteria bacterium]MCX7952995.1 bifunctional UDP-N-acetylglucosamine diphosphorylase/glucosamine-1-phosphate N-acetyltransferase GlmU [Deltaproteobacteria bacterium]